MSYMDSDRDQRLERVIQVFIQNIYIFLPFNCDIFIFILLIPSLTLISTPL